MLLRTTSTFNQCITHHRTNTRALGHHEPKTGAEESHKGCTYIELTITKRYDSDDTQDSEITL